MNGISGSFDEAVHRMGDVLAITGRVLPVTNQNVHLEAEFDNGSRCLGESKIFYAKKLNDCRIRKIRHIHPVCPRFLLCPSTRSRCRTHWRQLRTRT